MNGDLDIEFVKKSQKYIINENQSFIVSDNPDVPEVDSMLQFFSVANYGPFKDKMDFTMEATFDKEHPENVMSADDTDELILSSALIFGPNGAGKSSFVDAMASLKRMVSEPYPAGYRYGWYHPFALSDESSSSPISMCIELIVNGILYTYSISFTEDSVVSESLFHNPNGRRAKVFERDGPSSYTKARKAISDFTTTSSSYLTMAARFNDSDCAIVYKAITDIIVVQNLSGLPEYTCSLTVTDPDIKGLILDGLKAVDSGISDFTFDGSPNDGKGIHNIRLVHSFKDISGGPISFPIGMESDGTRVAFGLMGPIAEALSKGRVLMVDDLGSALHTEVTRWVLEQFAFSSEGSGAQLIASTHDLDTMDRETIRRDQIWFVDRNLDNGESELYTLTDFNGVRKDTDYRKAYGFGKFGALPTISGRIGV